MHTLTKVNLQHTVSEPSVYRRTNYFVAFRQCRRDLPPDSIEVVAPVTSRAEARKFAERKMREWRIPGDWRFVGVA